MKKYRLLRNNKETGPFSAEELIQSGFKKYDLVWAEGKSAAWRYPGELDEFKLYAPVIEEQPFDRFYKKATSATTAKKDTSTTVTEVIAPVQVVNEPAKKEKPRIRIKADSHKIDTNVTVIEMLQQQNATSKKEQTAAVVTPEWKEMWLDWEQEKKAVTNIASQKNDEPVLQTKFSQSLDDIKERYVETILNPATKTASFTRNSNYITAAVLIAVILGFGIWMGVKWSSSPNIADKIKQPETAQPLANTEPVQEEPTAGNDITASVNNVPVLENNEVEKTTTLPASIKNTGAKKNINEAVIKPPVSNKITTAKQTVKPSATKSIAATKEDSYKPVNVSNTIEKPSDKVIATEKNNAAPAEPKKASTIFRGSDKEPKIKDYVAVDTYAPSQTEATGVKYRVQNISDIPVDMVMIDLQYFDASGRYVKGETVYVRNVSPQQTITIQAPDNNKAASIKYKVSMVSSEKNNLYLIAD